MFRISFPAAACFPRCALPHGTTMPSWQWWKAAWGISILPQLILRRVPYRIVTKAGYSRLPEDQRGPPGQAGGLPRRQTLLEYLPHRNPAQS